MDKQNRKASEAQPRIELRSGACALVIVAHPDDETIWMGGTIARYKNLDWTIFALCRKSDPDRMPKFLRAAKHYGASAIICDLEDEGIMTTEESIPVIRDIIRKELPEKEWDVLFTHGANGEYGHVRHKGVHQAVRHMLKTGDLKAKNVFFFAYKLDHAQKIAVPKRNAAYQVKLSNKEWKAKRNVIKKLYGFRQTSFENRSCNKIETFSALRRSLTSNSTV